MKKLKLFEDFIKNNKEGDSITFEDIKKCIEKGGSIYATIVQEIPDNDPKLELKPTDIDDSGLVTVEQDNKIGYVKITDIEKIEF
jgi:hypothetical protein